MTENFAFLPETLVTESIRRWVECAKLYGVNVLKLGVLRDLKRQIHSAQSRYLAENKKQEALGLKRIETQLDQLLQTELPDSPLPVLLSSGASSGPIAERKIPNDVFDAVDRSKLERYDRIWEKAILAEAMVAQWALWTIDSWVQIQLAESWEKALGANLWPKGVILFTEAVAGVKAPQKNLWRGRWFVILHPEIHNPDELEIPLHRMPGAYMLKEPPVWKKVYPR